MHSKGVLQSISRKMKVKSLAIVLEKQKNGFRPGDLVIGWCVLTLDGEMPLSQLSLQLKGEAICDISQIQTAPGVESSGKALSTALNKDYCSGYLICKLDNMSEKELLIKELTTGQHNIGFTFQLPESDLPSSFEGKYGSIRYTIKARIGKKSLISLEMKKKIPIKIKSHAFATIGQLSAKVLDSDQKKVGIFDGKPVEIRCELQRIGHNIGTAIPINCFIDNKTKRSMRLRAALKQVVIFKAKGRTQTTENKFLPPTYGNAMHGNGQSEEVLNLMVSNKIPVTLNCCPIITIKYLVVVTLDIPGAFDLHCELPVILTNESLPFDKN